MNSFYLNECLGDINPGCEALAAGLVTVIKAFHQLAEKKNLRVDKGWVLEKEPAAMQLSGESLQKIVDNMRNKECKRLFFVYCLNYPVHKHYPEIDVDELLDAEYRFENADAINMVIAHRNGGVLMSVPVSDKLQKNMLVAVSCKDEYPPVEMVNLHGATEENIKATERVLLDRNYEKLDGLEKIECLAPSVKFTEQFVKRFEGMTDNDRRAIFDRIDEARRGNLLQPLRCNGTVIKHVNTHVEELRIVNPVDIRVYFHEQGDSLYFAKAAFKSEYVGQNDQNKDIDDAERLIVSML